MKRERDLSRRERQIVDILYQKGSATNAEIRDALPDPPTDSAVRAALRLLEAKGWVEHDSDGQKNVYRVAVPKEQATRSALRHLLSTFFGGSREKALLALMEDEDTEMSDEALDRLSQAIDEARKGRES